MEQNCCAPSNLDKNQSPRSGLKALWYKCACHPYHLTCVILLAILICLAVTGFILKDAGIFSNRTLGFSDHKAWQAIFLNSNQVYFGRIISETDNVLVLKNIYYVQIADLRASEKEQADPQPQLIKFGNELHGPADEMRINKQNILYVEVLRSDSQIARAIEAAEKK